MAKKYDIVPRELETRSGICKHCGQINMVKAPPDASGDELNDLATEQCSCAKATGEKEKKQRLATALIWIDEVFVTKEEEKQKAAIKSMVQEVFAGNVRGASIRMDERTTIKISINKNGLLKIERIFKEQGDRQF